MSWCFWWYIMEEVGATWVQTLGMPEDVYYLHQCSKWIIPITWMTWLLFYSNGFLWDRGSSYYHCCSIWSIPDALNCPRAGEPPHCNQTTLFFFAYVSHLSKNSYPFTVPIFGMKSLSNLPSQALREKAECWGLRNCLCEDQKQKEGAHLRSRALGMILSCTVCTSIWSTLLMWTTIWQITHWLAVH